MRSRLDLVASRAKLDQFDFFMNASTLEEEELVAAIDSENLGRRQAVYTWIKPTDMDNDQEYLTRIRVAYPGTCSWLLEDGTFQEWFDQQSNMATLPKLMWLNGKPGAGESLQSCVPQ
jgi:hypothetical protein